MLTLKEKHLAFNCLRIEEKNPNISNLIHQVPRFNPCRYKFLLFYTALTILTFVTSIMHIYWLLNYALGQWSQTFLAPGTAFVEDNFSIGRVGRGTVWGRFTHTTFIVHFISRIITLTPSQIIMHQIQRLGTLLQGVQEQRLCGCNSNVHLV